MANTSAVGVEITPRHVRAAQLDGINTKHPTLRRYHEVALTNGIAKDGEVVDSDFVARALEQLWREAKFTTRNLVVGIGNQRVLVRDLTVPKMSLADIKASLPYQVQELLPVSIDEAILDFYPIRDAQSENGRAEVEGLLIAAVKNIVQASLRAVDKAHLKAVRVDLIPFAIARALKAEINPDVPTTIIEIGARTTHITIVSGGVPSFIRFIPAGGDTFTDAIAKATGLTFHQSDVLKRKLGVGRQGLPADVQPAAAALHEQISSLYRSISNTIHYYQEQHPDERIGKILLSGSGAALQGIQTNMGAFLRVPVQFADPFNDIRLDRGLDANVVRHHTLDLVAPIGLATGGVV